MLFCHRIQTMRTINGVPEYSGSMVSVVDSFLVGKGSVVG